MRLFAGECRRPPAPRSESMREHFLDPEHVPDLACHMCHMCNAHLSLVLVAVSQIVLMLEPRSVAGKTKSTCALLVRELGRAC